MSASAFPDLRVVPVARCVLHEETDVSRVERLMVRFADEGVLRNPPVVGSSRDFASLLVLDGATRVTALRALGVPHVVVQVVDYAAESVRLHMWGHLLSGVTLEELAGGLGDVGVFFCGVDEVEAGVARREVLAFVAGCDGRCLALGGGGDVAVQAAVLRRLFAVYGGRGRVFRVPLDEWSVRLGEYGTSLAVVFPHYGKADLLALVRAGAVLPAGVTRHVVPGRALHVNVPFEVLCDARTDGEKQGWLDVWLQERRSAHRVRYYAEPTFLFDE